MSCEHAFRSPVNGYLYCDFPGVRQKLGYNPYCRPPEDTTSFRCPLRRPPLRQWNLEAFRQEVEG